MKTSARSRLVGALLLASAFFVTIDGFARSPRSRPMEGTVESINLETRTLTLAPADSQRPSFLVLTKQTKFLHNWRFASPSELKAGTRAVVYYRSPFFGKPFATKIIWNKGD